MSDKGDSARGDRSARSESSRSSTSRRSRERHLSPIRREPKSPRSPRHNKIYRCPPTPPPDKLLVQEKSFVLDSMATASISGDYSKANPKLGPVIPPYNSQRDPHTSNYFRFLGVDRTLKKTFQRKFGGKDHKGKDHKRSHGNRMITSLFADEPSNIPYDCLYKVGGYVASTLRSRPSPSGLETYYYPCHSRETIDGHAQFMQDIKPITGYNGPYGFRRNTPWLRQMPSPFGTSTLSRTHEDKKDIVC
ncbi:hypothetical protein LSH36_962g00010 [Paralvinella palmiformis]|uniref:Uncharacterized protein n=1 Tax=Paralvinella palmiformis TaxID=53620 RepID=A0AAD9MR51_9ANNE|nr:hypothetical protein LSH36_962g00010 [Paralvinella palmiformis]